MIKKSKKFKKIFKVNKHVSNESEQSSSIVNKNGVKIAENDHNEDNLESSGESAVKENGIDNNRQKVSVMNMRI
jgi:hypothetical protein